MDQDQDIFNWQGKVSATPNDSTRASFVFLKLMPRPLQAWGKLPAEQRVQGALPTTAAKRSGVIDMARPKPAT